MCDKSSKTSTENNNYVDFIKVKNLSKNYKFFRITGLPDFRIAVL
jgi:hypothetical protein